MAEYIDRNLINYHKERVLNRWAESRHTDCDVSYKYIVTSGDISNIPTADVIERSKIDKAIEEMEGEYSTCNQDWIDGLNRALEILKKI